MKSQENKNIRNTEYYCLQDTLDKLYKDSKDGKEFNHLFELIISEENIMLAYRNIKANTGSRTAGTDGRVISDLGKLSTEKLISMVRNNLKMYHPKDVRRVDIPKPNGKLRPLGIPCILDRLIQQCIKQILEPICEAKFYDRSNGFRPNRGAEQALAQVYKMVQRDSLYYVVNVDIKGFFDNVDHNKLIRQIWELGIHDKKVISIIKAMLKARIKMPDGTIVTPEKGTPQGGILSPLLANIVLNELDWWVASQWENIPTRHEYVSVRKNGTKDKGHKYRALRNTNLKEMYIIRYADDFVIMCRQYKDAYNVKIAVEKWLKERLKLEINQEKSKIINLKEKNLDYLGFSIGTKNKNGKLVIQSHISEKAKMNIKQDLINIIKDIQKSSDSKTEYQFITQYNVAIMGIHNYYRFATDVNIDLTEIGRIIDIVMFNRLKSKIKKTGNIEETFIYEKYGKSKMIRFIDGHAVIPIQYIQTYNPSFLKSTINQYSPEGRKEIYKNRTADFNIIIRLMKSRQNFESVEYADNRVSKYSAQNGKCAITGKYLEYDEIRCHHIIPREIGGSDEFKNLIIIHKDVHVLIHATDKITIQKYLSLLDLKDKDLSKLNKYRKIAGNSEI